MKCESSFADGPKILRPKPRLSKRLLTTAEKAADYSAFARARNEAA